MNAGDTLSQRGLALRAGRSVSTIRKRGETVYIRNGDLKTEMWMRVRYSDGRFHAYKFICMGKLPSVRRAQESEVAEANQEMIDGYIDGFDLSNPDPSDNRSRSYRHGFANGRADKTGKLRPYPIDEIRRLADEAMAADAAR